MKLQLLANLEPLTAEYSDDQKVMMALLTFLHRKYRDCKVYRMYARDIKIILGMSTHYHDAMNAEFPGLIVGRSLESHWLLGIQNAEHFFDDLIEVSITDPRAVAVMTHLRILMLKEDDWEDHNFTTSRLYNKRPEFFRFSPSETNDLFRF